MTSRARPRTVPAPGVRSCPPGIPWRLHPLLDPPPDQPDVGRPGGEEADSHPDLHEEPVDGAVGVQVRCGKNTKDISAIQPNSPTSKAVSDRMSAFAAATMPLRKLRPRIGAMAKYWKARPS